MCHLLWWHAAILSNACVCYHTNNQLIKLSLSQFEERIKQYELRSILNCVVFVGECFQSPDSLSLRYWYWYIYIFFLLSSVNRYFCCLSQRFFLNWLETKRLLVVSRWRFLLFIDRKSTVLAPISKRCLSILWICPEFCYCWSVSCAPTHLSVQSTCTTIRATWFKTVRQTAKCALVEHATAFTERIKICNWDHSTRKIEISNVAN